MAKDQKRNVDQPKKIQIGGASRYILGSGSYGVVYSINLKTAYKSFALMELEWLREVAITKFVQHRAIAEYSQVGIIMDNKFNLETAKFSRRRIYTAQAKMKYYESSLSNAFPFSDKDIFLITNHIATAMVHMHSKNVIHRDVKEGNILVSLKDNEIVDAVLCDFGLGKYASEIDSRPEYEMITISHRPPELQLSLNGDIEQILGKKKDYELGGEEKDYELGGEEKDYELGGEEKDYELGGEEKDYELGCEEKDYELGCEEKDYELLFMYDHRVDTWSFCMVLVFLMTGYEFYSFVSKQKKKFSNLLLDINQFHKVMNKFLRKHVDRKLKHLDFYMEILCMGLTRYEERESMCVILKKINSYIKKNKIQTLGVLYDIKSNPEHFPMSLSCVNKRKGNVQFSYRKKVDYQKICKSLKDEWKPLVVDINFKKILSESNIGNIGLFVAMNNLSRNLGVGIKNYISAEINIVISDNMLLASCYILANVILTDDYINNPVCENLINDSSIFQIALRVMALKNYDIIGLFGFMKNPSLKTEEFNHTDVENILSSPES
jgi:serine/threonine protein kinase